MIIKRCFDRVIASMLLLLAVVEDLHGSPALLLVGYRNVVRVAGRCIAHF
jgi:hypothetical protein